MKTNKRKIYIIFILVSEAVGAVSGFLTKKNVQSFEAEAAKPPLMPPGMLFPIVWIILFALMGIGAARVYMRSPSSARSKGLMLYYLQLAVNFFWGIFFFNMRAYAFAFIWLLLLWVLILLMTAAFSRTDKAAAFMQIPYILWITFAGYLNYAVWLLNR